MFHLYQGKNLSNDNSIFNLWNKKYLQMITKQIKKIHII